SVLNLLGGVSATDGLILTRARHRAQEGFTKNVRRRCPIREKRPLLRRASNGFPNFLQRRIRKKGPFPGQERRVSPTPRPGLPAPKQNLDGGLLLGPLDLLWG